METEHALPSSSTPKNPTAAPQKKPGRQWGPPVASLLGGTVAHLALSLTVILRATPSSCEASSRILWAIRRGGPPSERGRDRWARTLLPETKWSCTAAVSFLRARRPCHTMGYFFRSCGRLAQGQTTNRWTCRHLEAGFLSPLFGEKEQGSGIFFVVFVFKKQNRTAFALN